jgi:large subunit ribosomal protein L5
MEEFGYRNVMQVPRLVKVAVNMRTGDATQDARLLDAAMKDLSLITGQKPKVCRAKKSVASFHLRKGMPVGLLVTLRRDRMYDFLDRLFNVAIPRIRDFRGLSLRGFDGRGNYSFGIREHTVFPELNLDEVVKVRGMDITIVTTAPTDQEAAALLRRLGMPLRER